MNDKAPASLTVTVEGTNRSATLPLKHGSIGPSVVDIRRLYGELGVFTFDPGYGATASCESRITYIDGDEGVLLYRGYPIEQLAEKSHFIEVAYLLLHGELPNAQQLAEFDRGVRYHTMIHEQLRRFFDGFRRDAHPMAVMCGVVGAMAAFYHDNLDINDPRQREIAAFRLIAKVPTIAAWAYKYSIGQPFMYPRNDLRYADNFLYMLNAVPTEPWVNNPILSRAMDRILVLHADHEQNASTSTVRLAGSTGANPFACIAAGIAALWGPLHGGANQAVIEMLEEVRREPDGVRRALARARDPEDPFRLMGFGHRVYRTYDPRARILKEVVHRLLDKLRLEDPLLDCARALEEAALRDPWFVERRLYPNVDFYSGILLRAIGIPTNMFTVLFAIGRLPGWIAQWKESLEDPEGRLWRPRQIYVGPPERRYVPLEER